MKKLTIALLALAFAVPTFAKEHLVGGRGSSHKSGHYVQGKRSIDRGGRYIGGEGSSHKGGHYRNAKNRDRYDRRS